MPGFSCTTFTKHMIAVKALLYYTNLFFPNDYKKNDKVICQFFKEKYRKIKGKPWI